MFAGRERQRERDRETERDRERQRETDRETQRDRETERDRERNAEFILFYYRDTLDYFIHIKRNADLEKNRKNSSEKFHSG